MTTSPNRSPRPSVRTLALAAGLVVGGMLVGRFSAAPEAHAGGLGTISQQIGMLAVGQARSYDRGAVMERLSPNGAFAGPSDGYLIVTEWLPEGTPEEVADLRIEVDGRFSGRWDAVRNGVVIGPGEYVRNPNDVRIQMYGYIVDPSETRTIADLDRRLEATNALLDERLASLEATLDDAASGKTSEVMDSEMIQIMSTAMGHEVGAEVGRRIEDAMNGLTRAMERLARNRHEANRPAGEPDA